MHLQTGSCVLLLLTHIGTCVHLILGLYLPLAHDFMSGFSSHGTDAQPDKLKIAQLNRLNIASFIILIFHRFRDGVHYRFEVLLGYRGYHDYRALS